MRGRYAVVEVQSQGDPQVWEKIIRRFRPSAEEAEAYGRQQADAWHRSGQFYPRAVRHRVER